MTTHQVSVAAESFAATLLAQSEYNVSVQYGANQPEYDLIAEGRMGIAKISVKGSQDGGWALAISWKNEQNTYHQAIEDWFNDQKPDVLFIFVQFRGVSVGDLPRSYLATAREVADQMKAQRHGQGHLALREDYLRDHPRSRIDDKIPETWIFTKNRADQLIAQSRIGCENNL